MPYPSGFSAAQLCAALSPPAPSNVESAWCALPIGNNTALISWFSQCCGSKAVERYTYNQTIDGQDVPDCFGYCAYAPSSIINSDIITSCLKEKPSVYGGVTINCGEPTTDPSLGQGGATTIGRSDAAAGIDVLKKGWVLMLGIWVGTVILGCCF